MAQEASALAVTFLWSKVCSSCIGCKRKTKPADVQSQNLHQSGKPHTYHPLQTSNGGVLPPLLLLLQLHSPLHLLQAHPEPSLIPPWGKVTHETQGWWFFYTILHLQGRCLNGLGHATWHQTCSLYHCLLSTDFDL